MPAWATRVLINLALVLGISGGYLLWGREAGRLERELAAARAAVSSVPREWRVEGVVRAFVPESGVVVITHGEIPGLMEPMTMGFRAASPEVLASVRIGDAVRFTLRGVPPDVILTAIERAR